MENDYYELLWMYTMFCITSGVFECSWQCTDLVFILTQLAQILKGHHGGHTGQISGEDLAQHRKLKSHTKAADRNTVLLHTGDTHCLRDLLVLEALEVTVLVHAVHHRAVLWFHPTLRHQVELRVQLHSLHLGVVVVIGGEAEVALKTKTRPG